MERNEKTGSKARARFSLSQETITMVTVGVALSGIILVNQGAMRAEWRADREALRAEAQVDRARMDAKLEAFRAEAQAHRAKMDATVDSLRTEAREDRARSDARIDSLRAEGRADREAFAKQITRLVEQQGTLSGLVEGLEHAIASSGE